MTEYPQSALRETPHTLSASHRFSDRRIVPLQSAPNVRDIGGYATTDGMRTRWGRFFRSSGLHKLPPGDHAALMQYGIRSIVDLRPADEAGEAPDHFADSTEVRYHSIPLMRGADLGRLGPIPQTPVALNLAWLEHCGEDIKAVFDALIAPDAFPTLVHCTLGKDRTGLITALVLGVLRVPAAAIVDDYTLSALHVELLLDIARANAARKGVDPVWFERRLSCRHETMELTLEQLEARYDGIEAYLRSVGVTDAQQGQLRADLREPLAPETADLRHPG
jgi:protein-tyrosine phosphatase